MAAKKKTARGSVKKAKKKAPEKRRPVKKKVSVKGKVSKKSKPQKCCGRCASGKSKASKVKKLITLAKKRKPVKRKKKK